LDERGYDADRDRTLQNGAAAVPDDECQGDRREQLDGREEQSVVGDGPQVRLEIVVVDVPEGVEIGVFAVEQLNDAHTRDPLVQERVDPCQPDTDVPVGLANPGPEEERRHEHEGQHAERDQRQLPVHAEHGGHDEDQREDITEHRDDAGAEQLVERLDVAGDSGDQATGGIPVVKTQVQAL
jgi:hypothetical protein